MSSNSNCGILLVAHSSEQYVAEAVALAQSIRLNSPGIPVCLATDQELGARSESVFDRVIAYDFTGKEGVICKLWLDEMSPYSETTIFLDSDAFVFRDLEPHLNQLRGIPFAPLGISYPRVGHWFADCAAVMRRFGMKEIPFFIGDFYWFDRSPVAKDVFRRARSILQDYDSIGINRLHGGFNDEPVFSLAMHQAGVPVQPREPDQIVALESLQVSGLKTNVLEGRAECVCKGVLAKPAVVHYGSYRSQPCYFSERMRLERDLAGKAQLPEWRAALAGHGESFKYRAARQIRRIF